MMNHLFCLYFCKVKWLVVLNVLFKLNLLRGEMWMWVVINEVMAWRVLGNKVSLCMVLARFIV